MRKNKKYSTKLKIAAVKSYLAGEGSLATIRKKYGISTVEVLRRWTLWYNGHREIKERGSAKGEIYMTKGRKTTQEE
jgi:transposase-like protein